MPTLAGRELNVTGCTFVAEGETAADILQQMIEHLEEEHELQLPNAEAILSGKVEETDLTHGSRLVLERIRERLDLTDKGSSSPPSPPTVAPGPR